MIKFLFSVYDSKARTYSNPFPAHRQEIAIRDFTRAVNDPSLDLCKFSEDFSLIELGEFDDEYGTFKLYDVPLNLGSGSQFKEV